MDDCSLRELTSKLPFRKTMYEVVKLATCPIGICENFKVVDLPVFSVAPFGKIPMVTRHTKSLECVSKTPASCVPWR